MKAHLLTSDFPLVDGQTQTADCGTEVEPAWIQWCWDSLDAGTTIPLSTMVLCSKCVHVALGSSYARQRYLYGIGTTRPDKLEEN
jgi:hypothetical protein